MWSTPGHSSDSLSFLLDASDGTEAAVLTGDTILGRGTTVVAYPDGNLGDYLPRCAACRNWARPPSSPATDPSCRGPATPRRCTSRIASSGWPQIRAALDELGPLATPRQIVERRVRATWTRAVWWAAELSVSAQLAYLRGE